MTRRIVTTGVVGFGPLPRLVRQRAGESEFERLFASVDLPLKLLDRREARLPLADMVAVFDRAADLLGDPWLGLTVGRGMRPEEYGTWARYAAAGPTLRHGLARLCRAVRYYQADDSIRGGLHGDLARVAYHQLGVGSGLGRQHLDHVLPLLISFVRAFLGATWRPLWVEVPYAGSGAANDLADRLGTEVRYDRPGIGLVLDRALLDAAGRGVSPHWTELRHMVRGRSGSAFSRSVADVVDLRLTSGAVALDGAATRLGLRARTLQRRLRAEGLSYRQVVDSVRRTHAQIALAQTAAPVADIATRLGYAEPAHFTRAFHRWCGCSPSEWRRTRGVAAAP